MTILAYFHILCQEKVIRKFFQGFLFVSIKGCGKIRDEKEDKYVCQIEGQFCNRCLDVPLYDGDCGDRVSHEICFNPWPGKMG